MLNFLLFLLKYLYMEVFMKKWSLFLLASLFVFFGCTSNETDITGASWKLTEIISEDSSDLVAPETLIKDTDAYSPITVSFTETQATGTAVVNNFFSLVKIDENKLSVSNIGVTRKAGSPDMMKLEQHFFSSLIKTDHFQIKKDQLIIKDKNDTVLFVFAMNKLENTEWTLLAMNDGTALVSVPEGFTADISFGKDNSVAGSNGTNRYFGTYTIGEKNNLSFSKMGTTMMAGPEDMMILSDRFNTLLSEVKEYSLSGNTLSFRNAEKALVMTFTRKVQQESETK